MATGLSQTFKDFNENVSFNDYQAFVDHLHKNSEGRTFIGSVPCNNCGKKQSGELQGEVKPTGHGHPSIICDDCEDRIFARIQAKRSARSDESNE